MNGSSANLPVQSEVLQVVTECLLLLYRRKGDLRSYLRHVGVSEQVLDCTLWALEGHYMGDIIGEVLGALVDAGENGRPMLQAIIDGIAEQAENLARLSQFQGSRAHEVREGLQRLRRLLGPIDMATRCERARQLQRTEATRLQGLKQRRWQALSGIRQSFLELVKSSDDPQRRSVAFERVLFRLFAHHDLEPRGSFACPGEQTDGSIKLGGRVILVEAKWTARSIRPMPVASFRSKLQDKHDIVLGLMVSVAGFTAQAAAHASRGGRSKLVLMDGEDLKFVLAGEADLVEVLWHKLRCAAETGEAMSRPLGWSSRNPLID